MADAAEEKPNYLFNIKFSTSNGLFSPNGEYLMIFKSQYDKKNRSLTFNNIVIINLTEKETEKRITKLYKTGSIFSEKDKEYILELGLTQKDVDEIMKGSDIDSTFLIKTIVSTGQHGKANKEANLAHLQKIIIGDIINEKKDKKELIVNLRDLLRDNVNKKIQAGLGFNFKYSKKLDVKKTKSRSKSLRKSRRRKSKPRRKVKSPNKKKLIQNKN